jgi:hypothetical protein
MPLKTEELQYICLCGNKGFEIFHAYLKCDKCGQEYNYFSGFLTEATVFNGRRDALKRKVK